MVKRELIAERTIYAIDKDSRGFEIRIMIGKPYRTESENESWACPVAAVGLRGRLPDMVGVDSWQALMLARSILRTVLTIFLDDGGRLYWEKDGKEQTIEDIFQEPPVRLETPLTPEQYRELIDAITPEQLQIIDDALMAGASDQFRKVARVVGIAMKATEDDIYRIPDYFFASRVQKLVNEGRLVSQGDLERMRYSEVKLPD